MTKTLELPADYFASQLELRDGARIVAEVRGETVYLTVFEEEEGGSRKESGDMGGRFTEKWAGRFAPLLESDLSDDPRAQAILNR